MTSISLCHFPDDLDFGIIGSQRPQFIHATNGLPHAEADRPASPCRRGIEGGTRYDEAKYMPLGRGI
jgi:hypothetical protein